MNYETATKFELTCTLAALYDGFMLANCDGGTDGVMVHDITQQWYFDPCNNWSDIMPIAVELGAELAMWSYIDGKELWIASRGDIRSIGNPRRALVICCIKVLEAQK